MSGCPPAAATTSAAAKSEAADDLVDVIWVIFNIFEGVGKVSSSPILPEHLDPICSNIVFKNPRSPCSHDNIPKRPEVLLETRNELRSMRLAADAKILR